MGLTFWVIWYTGCVLLGYGLGGVLHRERPTYSYAIADTAAPTSAELRGDA
jgi:hypothetical protein